MRRLALVIALACIACKPDGPAAHDDAALDSAELRDAPTGDYRFIWPCLLNCPDVVDAELDVSEVNTDEQLQDVSEANTGVDAPDVQRDASAVDAIDPTPWLGTWSVISTRRFADRDVIVTNVAITITRSADPCTAAPGCASVVVERNESGARCAFGASVYTTRAGDPIGAGTTGHCTEGATALDLVSANLAIPDGGRPGAVSHWNVSGSRTTTLVESW